jgi:hypothetical protein
MRYSNIPNAARKYHYWRGVKSAAIVLVPLIIVLLIACNAAINALLG